jgi:hypothetical protein
VANYSGLPSVIEGRMAEQAAATVLRIVDELLLVEASRIALWEWWQSNVGHHETGPLAAAEQKVRALAMKGRDPEDIAALRAFGRIQFDSKQGRFRFGDGATP